jgi:hypothetical protein
MSNSTPKVSWEKQGNTWWVQCRCETWFPANDEIAQHPTAKLRCPSCGASFGVTDAARVLEP